MYKTIKRFSALKGIIADGIMLCSKKVKRLEAIRTCTGFQSDFSMMSFKEMLEFRRQQAKRTVLVQINSSNCCEDLLEYLSSIGKVKIMYHYQIRKPLDFALVEMEDEESFNSVLDHTQNDQDQSVPARSNFLTFKSTQENDKSKLKSSNNLILFNSSIYVDSEHEQFNFLQDVKSIRSIMSELHDNVKMNEIGYRLRFLTINQLETNLKFFCPWFTILPFGSSMSGFGTIESDLDMSANIDRWIGSRSSDLQFEVKEIESSDMINMLHEIIKDILPGCSNVVPLPNAKCPIVNYYQRFTNVDCDIALHKTEAPKMAELLFLLSTLDDRIKLLVFLIRHWASVYDLTTKTPNLGVSNFCLTLLTIHFLQTVSPPIIPPWSELCEEGRTEFWSSEEYVKLFNKYSADCRNNQQPVEELLLGFFKFYSEFNFADYGIDVKTGEKMEKESGVSRPLMIENHVDPEAMIGKNVSAKAVMRLRKLSKISLKILDGTLKPKDINKLPENKDKISENRLVTPGKIRSNKRVSNFRSVNF